MRSSRLAGTIVIGTVLAIWTHWAFTTEWPWRPGMSQRGSAFIAAFMGWYVGVGLWFRFYGAGGEAGSRVSPAERARARLEREQRDGTVPRD